MYPEKWVGYFAGVIQPESHQMGMGAFLLNPKGELVWKTSQTLGEGTQEWATYLALLTIASEISTHRQVRRVTLQGHFGPVIAQINGEQTLENQTELEVAKQIWTIMHNFHFCSVKRISPHENQDAIQLAKSSFTRVTQQLSIPTSQEVDLVSTLQLNAK